MDTELKQTMAELESIAEVNVRNGVSIISLICNAQRSSELMERIFKVLGGMGVNVLMISQGE